MKTPTELTCHKYGYSCVQMLDVLIYGYYEPISSSVDAITNVCLAIFYGNIHKSIIE